MVSVEIDETLLSPRRHPTLLAKPRCTGLDHSSCIVILICWQGTLTVEFSSFWNVTNESFSRSA